MTVTIECPSCATAFPVDPDKVPAGGARTECTVCETAFRVDPAPDVASEDYLEPWAAAPVEGVGAEETATESEEPAAETEELGGALEGVEAPGESAAESLEDDSLLGSISDPAPAETGDLRGDEHPAGSPDASTEAEDTAVTSDASETEGTGEFDGDGLVTEQWADLVDGETDEEVEVSLEWGDASGEEWVLETEEYGSDLEGTEVEPLETAEDQGRAAQEDLDSLAAAGEADSSFASAGADGEFADLVDESEDEAVFGASLDGGEIILPEDALDVGFADTLTDAGDAADADRGSASDDEGGTQLSDGGGMEGLVVEEDLVVEMDGMASAAEADEVPTEAQASGSATDLPEVSFQFGRRDPHDKARRLARVLVSDMIAYNPERHARALENATLKEDFAEEMEKSWAEYVEQVGPELAESTDYWRDALNDILARGEPLF
ncbi:MAG: zinc-ribbon domain-containing protein [Gemmatimonadota bacterium]